MSAPCCCNGGKSAKATTSCLGRCDLPKHKCLIKEDLRPGPVPRHMGWLYTARDAPEHQLRCGWRPGHISCSVLRKIEQHNCMKCDRCGSCASCGRVSCQTSNSAPPSKSYSRSPSKCPASPSSCCKLSPPCCKGPPCSTPMIRVIRHNGIYSIVTKPSNITNHPSGPYPLKYVLNTSPDDQESEKKAKFSVEAKFNDCQFDYTSSQASFILDFSPPDSKCPKPCPRRSLVCFPCQSEGEPDEKDSKKEKDKKDKKEKEKEKKEKKEREKKEKEQEKREKKEKEKEKKEKEKEKKEKDKEKKDKKEKEKKPKKEKLNKKDSQESDESTDSKKKKKKEKLTQKDSKESDDSTESKKQTKERLKKEKEMKKKLKQKESNESSGSDDSKGKKKGKKNK